MMSSSFLKATAVATPDFLLSPIFLWVTANVIIVWLVSSSRRRGRAANDDTAASSSAAHDGEVVPGAVENSFYASSSEYDAFADAPVSSKRLTREARAAARRSDRPRVREKPEPAGLEAPTTPWASPSPAAASADSAESSPGDDDEDVSMDSLWASIVQRRAARPVVVQKSESWGNEELPRLQRVAETAAARRQVVRKSVSAVAKAAAAAAPTTLPPPEPAAAVTQTGWRTRDVLVSISPDELLRRAESFIRRQREQLRLQRQESEQRQLLLQRRLHASAPPAPLIRV